MDKLLTKISSYNDEKLQNYFDNHLNLDILHKLKLYLDDLYYNSDKNSDLDDYQYDILKNTLLSRDPNYVVPIGSKIREGENRVKLPFWLGSMTKLKPDMSSAIIKWVAQNPSTSYIIEDKLDGVSCLAIFKNGKIKLYTRGDGIVGADISSLARYFKGLPKNLQDEVVVRGELIMTKKIFKQKYSEEYATARNLVSGRIGAKTIKQGLSDINFVAYEVVGTDIMDYPSKQLSKLDKMGFTTVRKEVIPDVSVDTLMEILTRFHNTSEYEIDGIIIQPDNPYKRNTSGNPSYAFAFKMRLVGSTIVTTVEEVLWKISKWGYYKPRIKVKPVKLSGVIVTYATAFNAKFIVDNDIGPGTTVELIRSGEVIPYIIRVISQSKDGAQMPEKKYKWNDTNIDIIAVDEEDEQNINHIEDFMKKLGIKFIGIKNIEHMYNDGLDSILKIITASQSRIEKVPGYGKKGAERAYTNIQNGLKNMDISTVLGASGIFGRGMGATKLSALLEEIPDIFDMYKTMTRKELYNRVIKAPGFAEKSTEQIVNNIDSADIFIHEMKKFGTFSKSIKNDNKLENLVVVFTGVRDKDLMKKIEKMGGKIGKGITNATNVLVYSSGKGDKDSSKMENAKTKGIEIMTSDEFTVKYM